MISTDVRAWILASSAVLLGGPACSVIDKGQYSFDGGVAGAGVAGQGSSGAPAGAAGTTNNAGGGGDAAGSPGTVGTGGDGTGGTDTSGAGGTNPFGGAAGMAGGTSSGGTGGVPLTPAVLAILPASAAFGTVVVNGQSGVTTFDVTNNGQATSRALDALVSGTDSAMFDLVGTDCVGKTLVGGAHCTLGVRFDPTDVGVRSASLLVSGENALTAALSGAGLAPSALTATPTVGDFHGVPVTGTMPFLDLPFTIRNTGGQTSGVIATGITGTNAAAFALRADGCAGTTLIANGTCTLTVRFTPGTRGQKLATLSVQGTPGGVLPISLSGTGQALGTFTLGPATGTFATPVDVGATSASAQSVALSVVNTGDLPATPAVTSSDITNFALTNGCTAAVAAGSSCTLSVAFTPKSFGPKSTTVSVTPGVTATNSSVISGTGRDQLALTVVTAGNGSGTVTAAAGVEGDGISCPTGCAEHYYRTTANPVVTLNATYNAATTNVAWSAPCAGSTTSCAVTLSAATTVTVTFTKKQFTVTVTRSAEAGSAATGAVSATGISCGATCATTVNAGDSLTLTATPTAGFYFSGWTGGGCAATTPTCTLAAIGANTSVDAKFTAANIIFTTAANYTVGQLQVHDPLGLNDAVRGADQYCRDVAAAGTQTRPFAGRTWTSLLTHGTALFTDRLGTKRGWLRADLKPFGDTISSADSSNVVYYPPALDENGVLVTDGYFTQAALGPGCVDWTSMLITDYHAGGVPNAGGYGWSRAFGDPCVYGMHLYCMSIDYTAVVTPPPPTAGRIAFITDGAFRPSGSAGLTAADAQCQTEAAAARLSGTYLALLATTTAGAASRMNYTGAIWVRPDGIPIVANPNDLNVASPQLISPIQVSPTKRYYGNSPVWTGGASPIAAGTVATTCSNWTAGAGTTGSIGQPYFTDFHFMQNFFSSDCAGTPWQLYCLQQ
jgi:Divergent InlB B-repeat domain